MREVRRSWPEVANARSCQRFVGSPSMANFEPHYSHQAKFSLDKVCVGSAHELRTDRYSRRSAWLSNNGLARPSRRLNSEQFVALWVCHRGCLRPPAEGAGQLPSWRSPVAPLGRASGGLLRQSTPKLGVPHAPKWSGRILPSPKAGKEARDYVQTMAPEVRRTHGGLQSVQSARKSEERRCSERKLGLSPQGQDGLSIVT